MTDDALRKQLAGCASPETLVAAILAHHPDWRAPVDVEAFARSVGIVEVRDLDGEGPVAALMADLEKTHGVVLCAPGLGAARRRCAIAHQLGHFLLASHRGDRRCASRDLGETRRDTAHRKEEMQANRFAAGLLMPKPWFAAFVEAQGKPAVAHLPAIARAFAVGLDIAATRYADLTRATCAFVFVKDGHVRAVRPSRSFPPLAPRPGDAAPAVPADLAAWTPTEARDWIALARGARPPGLTMQTLALRGGVVVVMLAIDAAAERRADEAEEKSATESPKFGRPRSR